MCLKKRSDQLRLLLLLVLTQPKLDSSTLQELSRKSKIGAQGLVSVCSMVAACLCIGYSPACCRVPRMALAMFVACLALLPATTARHRQHGQHQRTHCAKEGAYRASVVCLRRSCVDIGYAFCFFCFVVVAETLTPHGCWPCRVVSFAASASGGCPGL